MQATRKINRLKIGNSWLLVILALIHFSQSIAALTFPFVVPDDSQNTIDGNDNGNPNPNPSNIIADLKSGLPPGPRGPLVPIPSLDGNIAAEFGINKSFHKGPTPRPPIIVDPPVIIFSTVTPDPPTTTYYPTPYYTTAVPYYSPYTLTPQYPTPQPPHYQPPPPPHYAPPPHNQPPPPHGNPPQAAPCHENQVRRVSPKFASFGWGM